MAANAGGGWRTGRVTSPIRDRPAVRVRRGRRVCGGGEPLAARREQQRDGRVVRAARGRRAALRPGGKLPGEPAVVMPGGELGEVPGDHRLPRLLGLGIAVAVGAEQQCEQRRGPQVVRGGPEGGHRRRLAQARRSVAVEQVVPADRGPGPAVWPDGEQVTVTDLRADQPAIGDQRDEQGGTVGDVRAVADLLERGQLRCRVRMRRDVERHRLAPPRDDGPGQPVAQRGGSFRPHGCSPASAVSPSTTAQAAATASLEPGGAAEVAVMTVPVGDRDHDRARMVDGQGLGGCPDWAGRGRRGRPRGPCRSWPARWRGAFVRHGR